MAIEMTYDTAEAAPEEVRTFLKKDETTGKFKINLVPSAKLEEFRNTNIAVKRANEELVAFQERVKPIIGDNPDAFMQNYSALQELKKKFDNKEMIENSSFEDALKKRIEEMQRQYKDQIEKVSANEQNAKKSLEEVTSRYHSSLIERHVTTAVINPRSGALQEALPDILSHARSVFKVNDKGEIIPVDSEGNRLYGADGSSLLTPDEWLGQLRQTKPYFFKGSSGGGAMGTSDARLFNSTSIDNMTQAEYEKARKEGRIR